MKCGVWWWQPCTKWSRRLLITACLLLCTIQPTSAACASRCFAYRPYLCISRSAHSLALEEDLRWEIKRRFSVCLNDHGRSRFIRVNLDHAERESVDRRPTISVSVLECDAAADWRMARLREWPPAMSRGCRTEISLLLIVVQKRVVPVLFGDLSHVSASLNDDGSVQLSRRYTIDAIHALFQELFGTMNRVTTTTELPLHDGSLTVPDGDWTEGEESNGDIGHWPPWAIVLLIASVVLSAIAFAIGNCINKRNSPRPLKAGAKIPAGVKRDKRNWGAGFSGGMWAAA